MATRSGERPADVPENVRHGELLRPEILADPFPLFARLRTEQERNAPPGRTTRRLFGYPEVAAVLRDPRFSAAHLLPRLDRLLLVGCNGAERQQMAAHAATRRALLNYTDPPQHTRLRYILRPFFTPAAVAAMRPRIERIVAELIDGVRPSGRMDLIRNLAGPLPRLAIADILGVPATEHDRLKAWSEDLTAFFGPGNRDGAGRDRARRQADAFTGYLTALLAERRRQPRQDVLSALAAAESRGELTKQEVLATCITLVIGGHETTTSLIGSGLLALLRHPDQLHALRDDPALIVSAVEELARFDSPIKLAARVATEDVVIGNRLIREGAMVECWIAAANRDPAQFPHPDRLDLRREPNRHLAFGQGSHYCPGATLGRLEAQIAIAAVVQAFPNLRLATEQIEWQRSLVFRCPVALPAEW